MLVEPGHIRLTKEPWENWAHPAIDSLFRSASGAYGADVIGVVPTGKPNDGTTGLYEIKQADGITVVQDPADAVDHGLERALLPRLLARLVAERAAAIRLDQAPPTSVSKGKEMTAEYKLGQPVAVTCPDCGGAPRRTELGTLTRFGCHIGHVHTAEVMVAAQFAAMEGYLEAAMRSLSDQGELCRQMAEKSRAAANAMPGRNGTRPCARPRRGRRCSQFLKQEWAHPGSIEALQPSGG